jgi:hypothetical protein
LRDFKDKYSVYATIADHPKRKQKYDRSKPEGSVISPYRKNLLTLSRIPIIHDDFGYIPPQEKNRS